MLTEICAEIKNYFTYDSDKHFGDFSIAGGQIVPFLALPTDYIRICGSHLNDGVHKVSDHDLVDEDTFHGAIWIMSPPTAFLDLAAQIEAWQQANGGNNSPAMSPFQSESFGGYSYSKGASGGGASGAGATNTWQGAFGKRLNIYRRIRL